MQRYMEENTSSTNWEMTDDNLVPSTLMQMNDNPIPSTLMRMNDNPIPSTLMRMNDNPVPSTSMWMNDIPIPTTSFWPLTTSHLQMTPVITLYELGFATNVDHVQQQAAQRNSSFCTTCHAVFPLGETLSKHLARNKCKASQLYKQKNVSNTMWFECYSCSETSVRCKLNDISTHVANVHHEVWYDWEYQFMSYFCVTCETMLYLPWHVLLQHRWKCRSIRAGVVRLAEFNLKLPSMTIIMRRLVKDYLKNGRGTLKYACFRCKYYATASRNPDVDCALCLCTGNKFFCESCNVVFSCTKSGYDTHLYTFEHFYIKFCRIVESSAVPCFNFHRGQSGSKGGRDGSGVGRDGGGIQIATY